MSLPSFLSMRILLLLILLISKTLCASDDPLLAKLSQPMKKGAWELNLGISQYNRNLWMDAKGQMVFSPGGYTGIVDSDGLPKAVKGFRFELGILWQAGEKSLLELQVPYYYQEFSRDVSDSAYIYTAKPLDDYAVRRGDGLGDLNLTLRQQLLSFSSNSLGANLEFSVPTGQGPSNAAHSFVASGTGSFGGAFALEWEGHYGDLSSWLQGRMPFDLGANQNIGNGFFAGYQPGTTTPQFIPAGPEFVRRDPGIEADFGLAWVWAESSTYRHRLILELNAKSEGAYVIGSERVMDTAQASVVLIPQASFSYKESISLNFGWQTPPLWATNQAVANFGELLMRVDYAL